MTVKLYDDDPYLLEFDAAIVERLERDGRPAVVLDRTAFYAEGGGQPWDLGTLDGIAVTAVIDDGGRVVHVLECALETAQEGARIRGMVDAARRRDHMQQHHGQHLLSRAFVELQGVRTVGFHLGSDAVTIDLERGVGLSEVRRAVRRANEIVGEARPVVVRSVSRDEAERLGCGVPDEAEGVVRLVEAQGFDVQPCSGTHPRSTSEVGAVVALRAERVKGATRLHFVCGERALDAVDARLDVLDQLGSILSSPFDKLPAAARQAKDELAAARKRGQELLARALQAEAREMLAHAAEGPGGARLVVAAFDDRAPAELRGLALELAGAVPCLALLGARAEAAQLVFARTPGLADDVAGALRAALDVVGGRGGGKGDIVQGGGPGVARLDAALAAAVAYLRSGPA